MPVVGYGGKTINYLRLFSARASNEFNMQIFNGGDYFEAMEQKMASEKITKILYPSDSCWAGKELRLIQEYFLVACSLNDILRQYQETKQDLHRLAEKVSIQLNDTHPALTIVELMRIFMDDNHLSWEESWEITRQCCAYTNHTLLPEALEKWPVSLLAHVLPRHLEIIYEINQRFLEEVRTRWGGDEACIRRLSLIEEGDTQQVRMANLAIVGSHSVNGVAELHSELIKTRLVPDFYALWPERFNNKTNGVTPRRWLAHANPKLAELINDTIGNKWICHLENLKHLENNLNDSGFQDRFIAIKQENKAHLAKIIQQDLNIQLDVTSMFDVQVKRIHEYKRQLLNILHVIHQYLCLIEDGKDLLVKKTYIFAGKAGSQ